LSHCLVAIADGLMASSLLPSLLPLLPVAGGSVRLAQTTTHRVSPDRLVPVPPSGLLLGLFAHLVSDSGCLMAGLWSDSALV